MPQNAYPSYADIYEAFFYQLIILHIRCYVHRGGQVESLHRKEVKGKTYMGSI